MFINELSAVIEHRKPFDNSLLTSSDAGQRNKKMGFVWDAIRKHILPFKMYGRIRH